MDDTNGLEQMITHIFSQEPKEAGYYNLNLEAIHTQIEDVQQIEKNLADILMTIFSHGCKILFNNMTVRSMTIDHFEKIDKYMQSLGYITKYEFVYTDPDTNQIIPGKIPNNLYIWFDKLK